VPVQPLSVQPDDHSQRSPLLDTSVEYVSKTAIGSGLLSALPSCSFNSVIVKECCGCTLCTGDLWLNLTATGTLRGLSGHGLLMHCDL